MEYDIVTGAFGTKYYYKKGEHILHRENGPAVDGGEFNREWWVNDLLHREDGPAVERGDGLVMWYLNGKPHRIEGPAVYSIYGSIKREWWVDGERLSPEKEIVLNKWWNNKNGK